MNDSDEYEENWWVYPGFKIRHVTSDLKFPVNIAFVPNPRKDDDDPLFYVTELYGSVKVVTNDQKVHTYAKDMLNFEPTGEFPGSGESGLTGICVDPDTRDLFLSMIYKDGDKVKGKVIRCHGTLSLKKKRTIIDDIPSTMRAHQVQSPTVGFDRKLYVNVADGGDWAKSQVGSDLRGKILRLNKDGSIPWDNPDPSSPVFAKGFRNPFGAVWRKSDRRLYVSDNGPDTDDRIAMIKPYENYGWPGTMRKNSIFWWHHTQAPTALDFMQDDQFPPAFNDHLFVALFGGSYQLGRGEKGKKIVKMELSRDASAVKSYDDFVVYQGQGPASCCGLAFGPDGLYFSDLHGENEGDGNVYKVIPDVKQLKKMREKEEKYDEIWG